MRAGPSAAPRGGRARSTAAGLRGSCPSEPRRRDQMKGYARRGSLRAVSGRGFDSRRLQMSKLVVNELYASVQGEGTRAGAPCTFVRLTGCGLRCSWCDSEYTFKEGEPAAIDDVVAFVRKEGIPLVQLTGGEPLEQPGAFELVRRLSDEGFLVVIETG